MAWRFMNPMPLLYPPGVVSVGLVGMAHRMALSAMPLASTEFPGPVPHSGRYNYFSPDFHSFLHIDPNLCYATR